MGGEKSIGDESGNTEQRDETALDQITEDDLEVPEDAVDGVKGGQYSLCNYSGGKGHPSLVAIPKTRSQ